MPNRKAFTLIEVLVCLAVVALLLALLVVAVQRVRETAARAESQNNLRQIIVAAHNFAAAHGGRLPSLDGNPDSASSDYLGYSLLVAIRPHLEQELEPPPPLTDATQGYPQLPPVPVYVSPADPSVGLPGPTPFSSYAVNAQAFQGDPTFLSFRDGTSNTIALAEHYSTNCGQPGWEVSFGYVVGVAGYENDGVSQYRRATFADGGTGLDGSTTEFLYDYHPGTGGAGFPDVTFQVAPALSACEPRMAQTPHPSGMLVALGDGSVRTLSPSVSPATYWALVTPAGGEILGDDW